MRKGRVVETRVEIKVETNINRLQFGYWDMETEEFVSIEGASSKELQTASEKLECSELLLDALVSFAATISAMVDTDLHDIWRKITE